MRRRNQGDLLPLLVATQDLDGVSLVPLFRDAKASLRRDAVYWHVPGYLELRLPEPFWAIRPVSIIRSGDIKLFEYLEDRALELYDLVSDPGERRNLASEMPELSATLRGAHDRAGRGAHGRRPR